MTVKRVNLEGRESLNMTFYTKEEEIIKAMHRASKIILDADVPQRMKKEVYTTAMTFLEVEYADAEISLDTYDDLRLMLEEDAFSQGLTEE